MAGLGQDIRHGFRQLRLRPGWSLTVILVLALAIGANSAVYSAFEAWVLRTLDFEQPERLVWVTESQPQLNRSKLSVSVPNLNDWRAEQTSGRHWVSTLTL